MDKVLLRKISNQQTERFFFSYSPDWRLTQILTIEKILQDRYNFFSSIVSEIRSPDTTASDEAIITQEITNGLFFEGIAIAIQSIEDLFALINAAQKPLKFIGNIITYSAGKIDNLLKQKHSKSDIASLFYFPLFDEQYETEEQQRTFDESLSLLFNIIVELKSFYKKYRFFYTQYKHGLCVALRPYKDFDEKQIADHKQEPFSAYLHVFDNICVSKLDNADTRLNKKIFMPYLTEDITPNIQQLMKEDNLLRFVTSDDRIEFGILKDIVVKARVCSATLGNNLVNTLKGEYPLNLQLPADLNNHAYVFKFPKELYHEAKNKNIFI